MALPTASTRSTNSASDGRRPLKTRQWLLFQTLAAALAKRGVTPNAISVSSMVFAVAAAGCLAATNYSDDEVLRRVLWLLAAALIQLRLIANLLDGMVAIEGGKHSAVGELYNEVPDRISDSAILVGAGFAWGSAPILGFTAAMVALFVAYVRAIGAGVGVGQVFLGPFAKPQRMALLTAACVASALLPSIGICGGTLLAIIVGGSATAIRRLTRIAGLLRERQG